MTNYSESARADVIIIPRAFEGWANDIEAEYHNKEIEEKMREGLKDYKVSPPLTVCLRDPKLRCRYPDKCSECEVE
jgi:hypothetical protein